MAARVAATSASPKPLSPNASVPPPPVSSVPLVPEEATYATAPPNFSDELEAARKAMQVQASALAPSPFDEPFGATEAFAAPEAFDPSQETAATQAAGLWQLIVLGSKTRLTIELFLQPQRFLA